MRWLAFILFTLTALHCAGQSVVWSKVYNLQRTEFWAIGRNPDSSYTVVGVTDEPRLTIPTWFINRPSVTSGLFQSKISRTGDTLWMRSLRTSRYILAGVMGRNGNMYTLSRPEVLPDSSITPPYFYLTRSDTAANILSTHIYDLPTSSQAANGMFQAANGDLVIYGYTSPGSIWSNTQCDWLLMRIAPDGRLKWWKLYNPLAGYACGCAATEDINGQIVMVGTKDAQLAAQVVDSNGIVVKPMREITVNTQNFAFVYTNVRSVPDGGLLVTCNEFNPNQLAHGRIIKLDTGMNLVWQHRIRGFPGIPYTTTDTSLYVLWTGPDDSRLQKYNNRGTLINSVLIRTFPPGGRSGNAFWDALFDDNGSATVVGAQGDGRGSSAYIARIDNIGIPYNPVSTPSQVVNACGKLFGFPNPARDYFTVTGVAEGTGIRLFGVSGQEYHPPIQRFDNQLQLDVSALPAGMYFLKSSGRTLKFVRE